MFTALLMAAQGCRATEPAVAIYVHCAADGGTGLQSHGACSHNLYSLRCCWRHRAAEPRGLQSQSMFTALLMAAQGCRATGPAVTFYIHCAPDGGAEGCRATEPAVTIYVHCAAGGGTGLQSYRACGHNLCSLRCCWRHRAAEPWGLQSQSIFTALLMAAQGCRATEPAVKIYVHCAADGGTGLQSHGACSHNLYSLRC